MGQGGEHQPQPVGVELVATRPRAKQIQLRFLDAILGLAPLAVHLVVKLIRWKFEVGDDEARVVALIAEFQAGDQAPLNLPGVGGIGEFVYGALLDS